MTEAISDDGAVYARRDVRHNVVALAADFGLFLVGLSFVSQSTILPAFAAHLGASNVVIGAIPALMTLGWNLPSLFAAGYTESLARKLPFVLRYTVWERVPLLVLAAVAFFVARPAPAVALALLLSMLLLMTSAGGLLMPAWMDIVWRTVPTTLRGRFFAMSNLLGGAGGLLGSVLTAWVLARMPATDGYAVCFLVSALFMGLSYVALSLVREPPAAHDRVAAPPLGVYLRRVGRVLKSDHNLAWFLLARGLNFIGTMATGFFTVHALRSFAAPDWAVGVFTTALLAGQMLGNLVLGVLADRVGHLIPLNIGVAALLLANLVALVAPTVNSYKRLVPGYEAPVYIGWAQQNRSALIRLPRYTEGRNKSMRAELRFPDPSSNPYLAFAGMLAAALDGIDNNLTPPKPLNNVNLYHLDAKERKKLGVGELPGSLAEALSELAKDKVLVDALGPVAYEAFSRAKSEEWDEYRIHVTDYEIERYLETA